MSYLWINLNISTKLITDLTTLFGQMEYLKRNLKCDKIIVSVTSNINIKVLFEILRSFQKECQSLGIELELGPVFGDEGYYINGTINDDLDLYCLNEAQKLLWYLNKTSLNIKSLVYVDKDLYLEPIILSKSLDKEIQLYFVHDNELLDDLLKAFKVDSKQVVSCENSSDFYSTAFIRLNELVERDMISEKSNN